MLDCAITLSWPKLAWIKRMVPGRLASLGCLWILTGCLGGSTYRVEGTEAQRAVRELGQSDSVVVDATERATDRAVRLKLVRGDEVRFEFDRVDGTSGAVQPVWSPDTSVDETRIVRLDFRAPAPRENWIVAGVFLTSISVGAPLLIAIIDRDVTPAIPFYGPGVAIARGLNPSCSGWGCTAAAPRTRPHPLQRYAS